MLPGEDPAEFEAERRAWIDDWSPNSYTRAVLVERASVASWRLRRAVRAEVAWLASRADTAGHAFDLERFARVERAVAQSAYDPGGGVTLLEMNATGIDRLIQSCGEVARALEAGPSGWNQPMYHMRLMMVTRHRLDENPHHAGAIPKASARLLAANNAAFAEKPCFDYGYCVVVHPLPEADREAAAELLRKAVASELERLRGLRPCQPDTAGLRARAVAAAYCDGSEEGKLRHRYEMAIDRSLRATIGQLIALEKSGADLGAEGPAGGDEAGGCDSEVILQEEVAPTSGVSPATAEVVAPGSVGAGLARAVPASVPAAPGVSGGPNRAAARGGGGRSPR